MNSVFSCYCDAVPQVAAVTSRGVGNWTEIKSITPKKGEWFLPTVTALWFENLSKSATYWC